MLWIVDFSQFLPFSTNSVLEKPLWQVLFRMQIPVPSLLITEANISSTKVVKRWQFLMLLDTDLNLQLFNTILTG
jgi:hypothetical protein